jgi:hypothetical protein
MKKNLLILSTALMLLFSTSCTKVGDLTGTSWAFWDNDAVSVLIFTSDSEVKVIDVSKSSSSTVMGNYKYTTNDAQISISVLGFTMNGTVYKNDGVIYLSNNSYYRVEGVEKAPESMTGKRGVDVSDRNWIGALCEYHFVSSTKVIFGKVSNDILTDTIGVGTYKYIKPCILISVDYQYQWEGHSAVSNWSKNLLGVVNGSEILFSVNGVNYNFVLQ